MDDELSLIELLDEDGNTVQFEHLTTLKHGGEEYVVLCPAQPMEDIDEDEVIILRIQECADGDVYVPVEDEALLEALFDLYMDMEDAD